MISEDLYVVLGLDYDWDLGRISRTLVKVLGIFMDVEEAEDYQRELYTHYVYDEVLVKVYEGGIR